jgi:hypothetical protein
METMTESFKEIWSRPKDSFIEVEENSVFHLEKRITEAEEEKMVSFMLDENNIVEVIKSREDSSACGIDGISYRIMKGARTEGFAFMKLLVRSCIRSGRVIST